MFASETDRRPAAQVLFKRSLEFHLKILLEMESMFRVGYVKSRMSLSFQRAAPMSKQSQFNFQPIGPNRPIDFPIFRV
jgi:hypothetical protein